jgi:hypothetical protein
MLVARYYPGGFAIGIATNPEPGDACTALHDEIWSRKNPPKT